MLKAKTGWLLPKEDPIKEHDLMKEMKISPLLARVFVHRGLEAPQTSSTLQEEGIAETTSLSIDAYCQLSEVNIQSIEELGRLAPFDSGNEEPLFLLKDINITDVRAVGLDQSHLKCLLVDGEHSLEATGYDLGSLSLHISKNVIGSVVGCFVVHEWNGVRKPHFLIKDVSILHTQIYDYRGSKDKNRKLRDYIDEGSLILYFQRKSLPELEVFIRREQLSKKLLYSDSESYKMENGITSLFIYDLPYSLSDMWLALSRLPQPQRIYCLFGAEHENQLAVIPSREHFKWLYGFIHQKGYLKRSWVPKIAQTRGISEHAIQFMIEVFSDLEFVSDTGDKIHISPSPKKRELSESPVYRKKLQEMELETEILFSSFEDLYLLFKKVTLTEKA